MSSNPYRKDFPLLENNKVIYLDNAATSQRPEAVIQAEAQFYEKYNANPLRSHRLLRRSKRNGPQVHWRRKHRRDHFHQKYYRRLKSGGLQLWFQPFKSRR